MALAIAGCTSGGDSLVVVTVDAMPALAKVATLPTVSMAGDRSVTHDLFGPLVARRRNNNHFRDPGAGVDRWPICHPR